MPSWTESISRKLKTLPPARKKALHTLLLLAVWLFFLWRAAVVFAPAGEANTVGFNSDSAIPVLMSNDERPITVFNLYYYAAGRWGGWPFLFTHLARRVTGYRWTDQSLFVLQTLWIFIGALVFAALSRADRPLVLLVYLVVLCLHWESRLQIYELSQVYAWQVTATLLGWYAFRRLFESRPEPGRRFPRRERAAWFLLALFFSYLAIWSSGASLFFLLFLLTLEAARARWRGGDAAPLRKLITPWLLGLGALAAAYLVEKLQLMNYHRHAVKHYQHEFGRTFRLDTGHLAENLSANSHNLTKLSWLPLYLLPALALAAAACVFAFALVRKRAELRERLGAALSDDTAVLALGAYAIAAINFALVVLVDHVRLNNYDDRYLTVTNLFGPVSGILTLYLLLKLAAARSRFGSYVRPAFLLAALAVLLLKFPAASVSHEYQIFKGTAAALAQKAPRAILMGDYWDTYVFTALQGEGAMTAVPWDNQENRMPWTRELVRRAERVVVVRRRVGQKEVDLPQSLRQYGATFQLAQPKWYQNDWYTFAIYANEHPQSSPQTGS